ncbi:MAG TPA: HAMP domain-containing sensor histidine kinase [Gemmatimonadaceae bacterium]|nr:HAMP domain-containing sensor histidine kinase [Gemmatimonadaceae bacterium]
MTFRARMSVAFVVAALIPLAVLALGVRREVTRRLTAQHERRVNALVDIVRQDLARESASIAARLEILETDLSTDDRFRLGAVRSDPGHRRYVLDWAERAMEVAGLSMLRVYDDAGRVVSSGHFRNEFGREDTRLLARLAAAPGQEALIDVRTPSGSFRALARAESTSVGGRVFTIVGGTRVDSSFFTRLGRDGEIDVSLALGEAGVPATHAIARLPVMYVDDTAGEVATTHLTIAPRADELQMLRRDLDRWVGASFLLAAIAGAILIAWLAAGLSQPMATLARAALSIDFNTPDVDTVAARDDEVGTLARRFAAMTRRLRAGAVRLRDAERRATVGEMARQVNHDMKNGLVPIRNVLRHLSQVQERAPHDLATVYGERRATLDSSVTYLDELATRWARLTPRSDRRSVDVNTIVRDIAAAARDAYATPLHAQLQVDLPPVVGDPVALRRIFDNLVTNALQSLPAGGGSVTISAEQRDHVVRITVADTGHGMTAEELARALGGFYTTKPQGTGLGLSVVRRLVADHGGEIHIDTAPRRGTTVVVELPAHPPRQGRIPHS